MNPWGLISLLKKGSFLVGDPGKKSVTLRKDEQ